MPAQRNIDVTVVETAKRRCCGAVGEEVGKVFAKLHRDHGVDLRLETESKRSPPTTAKPPV